MHVEPLTDPQVTQFKALMLVEKTTLSPQYCYLTVIMLLALDM
jgi:hypothetical protein